MRHTQKIIIKICSLSFFYLLAVAPILALASVSKVESNLESNLESKAELQHLEKVAFDRQSSLESRWRAVTKLGRIYAKKSQGTLERAMQSQEWFMRNAALVVLPYGERNWARSWAERLLSDSALVVRTAAVQALRQLHSTESRMLLWEKLNNRENFHRGQPLWVRRHIIETLEQFSNLEDQDRFNIAKKDQDAEVRLVAERASQKIASRNTTLHQESLDSKIRLTERSKVISR